VRQSDKPPSATSLELLLRSAEGPAATGFVKAQRLHNDAGLLPLHVAVTAGDATIAKALLEAKRPSGLVNAPALLKDSTHNGQWGKKNSEGKIERLSSVGSTALHLAVQDLHDRAEAAEDDGEEVALDSSLVRVLLAHGAEPNALDGQLQSPLHIAIMGALHEVVELLCEAKADLTLGCKPFGKDNTALHQATILRDATMIKLLTDHGADPNAPGRDGWTPLCMAVRSNAVSTARALLEAKASVHAVCGNGKTALEVATTNKGNAELLDLLRAQ